jgi:hypothetical protein
MSAVDWACVEQLMLASFRGRQLTDQETDTIRVAYETDRKRYSSIHKMMKITEIDRIRRDGS